MPYKFNPFTGTLDEVGTGGGGGATNLDGLTDVTIAAPSDWEVLGYNATSGLWENTSHIHASVAGNLYVHIKNTDSVQLDKGTPFYITGTVGASDQVEVQAADNTDPTKGPAIGLVEDNLPINAEGNGVLIGEIYNYDTATPGWSTNDALYVSAAGAITNAQPASGYRQIVGYVGRVHASTGTIVVLGNQKDPVAGSDTEIQFNDNGGFGASADLTWDDTNKELGVGGDINLDDGGTFSTTVQSVTPTANRTISFPDATGTVALVSGANGTIQYNDAGTLKGNSNFTVNVDWDNSATTFTALKVNVPDVLQGASDSKLLDLQSNAASRFKIGQAGELTLNADGIRLNETYIYTGAAAGTLTHRVYAARGTQASPSVSLAGDKLIGYAAFPRLSTGFSGGPGARMQFVYRGDSASNTRATDIEFETSIGVAGIWPRLGIVNTGGIWIQVDGFNNNTANRVFLNCDAANTFAQRNGTASQTYRLYNTYANGGVDFERTSLTRDSSGLVIDAQKGGTGVDPTNLLDLQLDGTSTFKFDGANRRFYLGSNDYSYLDVSADGYTVSLTSRYGAASKFTFREDFIVNNSTRGILLGNQTYAPGIRLGTFTSPPTQVRILNASSPTSTMWLFGKYGGAYAASTNFHNGTGVSVWCGYGAQPTDANADGGNAGNFDVWLNAGGAGAGTGVAGANGRLRVINDDTDTEVFGVEQSGVVQIGGERLIADLPSSPTAGMITRVTDGDSGLTFGNTVTNSGAGATPYLCWYNGTNWTVIGA